MELIFDLEGILPAAQIFLDRTEGKKVFAFYGEMGAGKTTFILALCALKKVSSRPGSPTFPIINEYHSPEGKIFHIDLYRIKDEEEALRAGVEDCLYSGAFCFVEWPGKAAGIFPPDTLEVSLEIIGASNRKITFAATA